MRFCELSVGVCFRNGGIRINEVVALNTEEILMELIRRSASRRLLEIGPETRLRKDLKMDSFDFLNLVLKTESRFDCRLDDDVLVGIVTVGQFQGLVRETLAGNMTEKTEEDHV